MAYSEERESVFSQGACSLWEELQNGEGVSRFSRRGQVVIILGLATQVSVGAVQSQCSDMM